uniref:Ig-like domain-containing protein n=1 Tax=Sinocyclocheilus rhinocerous TaxID=307959 RepID=A0A673M2X9_9TELE
MFQYACPTRYSSCLHQQGLLPEGSQSSCFPKKLKTVFTNKDSYQKEVKVSASQKATLNCEVSDLKTEVKWFKDGKQLSSSRTVHMESKGKIRQLVLENVEKKDAGEYTCEVGNEKLLFKIQVKGKIF